MLKVQADLLDDLGPKSSVLHDRPKVSETVESDFIGRLASAFAHLAVVFLLGAGSVSAST